MAPVRRKLVVVGDGASGKTCLLVTFAKDEFPVNYIPTVFDTYVADLEVDGQEVELALWDTAGQEEYDRLRPLSYPDTNVVLIIFSLDSYDSLENVGERWNPEINHFCSGVPKILVGTKKDLRYNNKKGKEETVTYEQGLGMAQRIHAVEYMECSAMYKDGLREVFDTATRYALKRNRNKPSRCIFL